MIINGNGGNNNLSGTGGDDTISGFGGDDTLAGGSGDDSLIGGTGNDTLIGDSGNDTLLGGAGHDRLEGGSGADSLIGGTGNDTLYGNTGDNTLSGSEGDDIIYGGQGNDLIYGGEGSDNIPIVDNGGTDTIVGGEDPSGSDLDGIRFNVHGSTQGVNVLFTGDEAGTYSYGGSSANGIFSEIEALGGSQFNDTIDASNSNLDAILYGYSGADHIRGGSGDDSILGGEDDDTLYGDGGADHLEGEDGNDVIDGGWGDDKVYGGSGSDTLQGGSGDDTIYGDGVIVDLNQVASPSTQGNSTSITVTNSSDGAVKVYSIDSSGGPSLIATINPGSSFAINTFEGNSFVLVDDVEGKFLSNFFASPGLNYIYGDSSLADDISGGSGNDTIYGQMGNDTISGNSGQDLIRGGTGNDIIYGDAGADILLGDSGNDRIYGGADSDRILIRNDSGNDTIEGGETGDDVDRLEFVSTDPSGVTVTFTGDEAGTFSTGSGTGNFIEIEAIRGSNFGDNINAGAGTSDILVWSRDGDDTITGGGGDDTLDAGAGADVITGGAGSDLLTGGAGNDTFVFSDGDGADQIKDFDMTTTTTGGGAIPIVTKTNDQLDVSGLTNSVGRPVKVTDVVVTDDGLGNSILTFPSGDQILLSGVAPSVVSTPGTLQSMGVPCFAQGTLIATPKGETHVEELVVGDLVCLADGGTMPIIWRGSRELDKVALEEAPHLYPVRVRAGFWGAKRDLILSPQHALALPDNSGLIRAVHLVRLGFKEARIAKGRKHIVYHHLLLPRHVIIKAEGVRVESFYPGPFGLSTLKEIDREKIIRCIWQQGTSGSDLLEVYGPRCLPLLTMHELRSRNLMTDMCDYVQNTGQVRAEVVR